METNPKLLDAARLLLNQKLLEKGHRRSTERFALLDEVYARNDHFDVEDLLATMTQKGFHLSRATIYNTLDLLEECGLVRRHRFTNEDVSRYEKALGRRQHDHLICTDCLKIKEFCDPRIEQIQQNIGKTLAFTVRAHSLVFYGRCADTDCLDKPA